MTQGQPSQDLVYSEADMAERQQRWEQAAKEREYTTQLALLAGQMQSLPRQIEDIARRVVQEVLEGERKQAKQQLGIRANLADRVFLAVIALATLFVALKQAHII